MLPLGTSTSWVHEPAALVNSNRKCRWPWRAAGWGVARARCTLMYSTLFVCDGHSRLTHRTKGKNPVSFGLFAAASGPVALFGDDTAACRLSSAALLSQHYSTTESERA